MANRAHNLLPRVTAVGARGERTRGHVCGRCRQPGTGDGVPGCPNNRAAQTVPYRESEWAESQRLDAEVDRMREERAFDR